MGNNDIQKLRALPIESVAQRLGLQVARHKALCPFHDDRHPSLCISTAKNRFRCFVCNAHGDVIDLTMKLLGTGFRDACLWLSNEHNVLLHEWKPASRQTEEMQSFDAARYERYFEHPFLNAAARHFLFAERHIDARVVSWCRLSSWTDREGITWLQIPYYDPKGRLVGLQARNLNYCSDNRQADRSQLPRFRFPRGSSCHLYNMPVLSLLAPGEPLYLTEGCSDCWAMLSSGHKAIAIPSATLLREDELEPLRGRELHIYPDCDEAGEMLYGRLLAVANQIGACLIRHGLPEGMKDYGQYWASQMSTRNQPLS